MIHFFIGTKAQFIKMAPVMVELKRRGTAFHYVDSGQHADMTRILRQSFGIPEPDVCLRKSGDVTSIAAAVGWSLKLVALSIRGRKWLSRVIFPGGGVCLIHGDTLSTLLGMRMAKAAGLKVAHVEAGLRSFCIWHPFPEELIRIYCMKRCDMLFAPSEQALRNLKDMNVRGRIFKVNGNTVVDALRLAEGVKATVAVPAGPFALATCHRLETITRRRRLKKVVLLLNRLSKQIKVVFVTHKPTRKYLKRFSLTGEISPEIVLFDMQDYMNFAALLRSAKMVLTDGGSIQEECAYLNKPCLILRKKTERLDGLGRNAMLWNFDQRAAEEFYEKFKSFTMSRPEEWPKPSEQIVEVLLEQERR